MIKMLNSKPETQILEVCNSINSTAYDGENISKDVIKLGTVFFASEEDTGKGIGFGVVYNIMADGLIVEALSCSGNSRFMFTLSGDDESVYACTKRVPRHELLERFSTAERVVYEKSELEARSEWAKEVAEEEGLQVDEVSIPDLQICCIPVDKMYILGELRLPLAIDENGETIEGVADYLHAKDQLEEYVYGFGDKYNEKAGLRKLYEFLYLENRDLSKMTHKEKAFDPTKSEFICSVCEGEDYDSEGEFVWYYRSRNGRFYACVVDAEERERTKEEMTEKAALYSLATKVLGGNHILRGTSKPIKDITPQKTDFIVHSAKATALSETAAEEKLRNAVMVGRLSPFVFAKYFGEYADQKVQISSLIPAALKKRIEWTGLTIEKIIEMGCDARLAEVQADFDDIA
ncbi:MAG: hypothetical protein FWC97_12625 [Treponema sp.]|nr:hypothetical protein [Treponema sp.]